MQNILIIYAQKLKYSIRLTEFITGILLLYLTIVCVVFSIIEKDYKATLVFLVGFCSLGYLLIKDVFSKIDK